MNPVEAAMAAILIVRELRQIFAFDEIPEDKMVEIVKNNLTKISTAIETAKKEMAQYGKG